MIMQVLRMKGVTAIFVYSGGAILPTYDAVFLYTSMHVRDGRARSISLKKKGEITKKAKKGGQI